MPVIYNYDDSEGTFDFEQNVRSADKPWWFVQLQPTGSAKKKNVVCLEYDTTEPGSFAKLIRNVPALNSNNILNCN
jgi:hypothetical protein